MLFGSHGDFLMFLDDIETTGALPRTHTAVTRQSAIAHRPGFSHHIFDNEYVASEAASKLAICQSRRRVRLPKRYTAATRNMYMAVLIMMFNLVTQ